MSGRTIAIGDIHGCSVALTTLLDRLALQPEDTVILLGDYTDRGPDSRRVLDRLVALVGECELIPLVGNHEILLLDSLTDHETLAFWRQCGGDETLASYGGSLDNLPPEHLVFLRGLRPFHETETHLFVHANYLADQSLDKTSHAVLFWEHITPRLPRPHASGKAVVVGHTPQASGRVLDLGYLICLDTYCFGGGWLTALDVASRRIWQANQDGEWRTDALRSSPPPRS